MLASTTVQNTIWKIEDTILFSIFKIDSNKNNIIGLLLNTDGDTTNCGGTIGVIILLN